MVLKHCAYNICEHTRHNRVFDFNKKRKKKQENLFWYKNLENIKYRNKYVEKFVGKVFYNCMLFRIFTTQQQQKTMRKPQMAPAVPTTHVKRMNNITPNMFWIHGKNTPINVPVKMCFIVLFDEKKEKMKRNYKVANNEWKKKKIRNISRRQKTKTQKI